MRERLIYEMKNNLLLTAIFFLFGVFNTLLSKISACKRHFNGSLSMRERQMKDTYKS